MANDDFETTTQEYADLLGVEKVVAYGLMRFLLEAKLIKKLDGTLKVAGAKGKGADMFAIPASTGGAIARLLNGAYAKGRAK